MKITEKKMEDLIDYFRTYRLSYDQIAKKLDLDTDTVKEAVWQYLQSKRGKRR